MIVAREHSVPRQHSESQPGTTGRPDEAFSRRYSSTAEQQGHFCPASTFRQEALIQLHTARASCDKLKLCHGPLLSGASGPQAASPQRITPDCRTIVHGWLFEVVEDKSLSRETLFVACSLLDRFLARTPALPRATIQCAATAALLLATKYVEETPLSTSYCVMIAAHSFTQLELLRMERLMFSRVGCQVLTPTVHSLCEAYAQVLDPGALSAPALKRAEYAADLSLLDYELLRWNPAVVAEACLLAAAQCCGDDAAAAAICALSTTESATREACAHALTRCVGTAESALHPDHPVRIIRQGYARWLDCGVGGPPPMDSAGGHPAGLHCEAMQATAELSPVREAVHP